MGQKYPTEQEHRSAEQAYWDRHIESQNRRDWVGWITLVFSSIAAVGVILGFLETRRQAQAAIDQMEVANGPDMHMVEIHVWNKGEGGSQNFLNTLPTLTAGQALSGTAIFANLGSYPAIFDTYINVGVFWRDKPLNMVNPLWGEKGRYSFPMAGTQIPPGDHRVWNFEIAVPVNAENFTLYILCDLNYRDRLFVTHRKYIARAYSPTKGFFIKTDDTKDYEETE